MQMRRRVVILRSAAKTNIRSSAARAARCAPTFIVRCARAA